MPNPYPYLTPSNLTLPYPTLLNPILPYPTLSYPTRPNPTQPCPGQVFEVGEGPEAAGPEVEPRGGHGPPEGLPDIRQQVAARVALLPAASQPQGPQDQVSEQGASWEQAGGDDD